MEVFFEQYSNTFSAIGAIGTMFAAFATMLAVIVSLYLAFRQYRSRARVGINMRVIDSKSNVAVSDDLFSCKNHYLI